jgi:hypothetical protein
MALPASREPEKILLDWVEKASVLVVASLAVSRCCGRFFNSSRISKIQEALVTQHGSRPYGWNGLSWIEFVTLIVIGSLAFHWAPSMGYPPPVLRSNDGTRVLLSCLGAGAQSQARQNQLLFSDMGPHLSVSAVGVARFSDSCRQRAAQFSIISKIQVRSRLACVVSQTSRNFSRYSILCSGLASEV